MRSAEDLATASKARPVAHDSHGGGLRVRPVLNDVEIGPRRSSRGGRRLAGSDQAPVLSEHAAFLGRCVPLESLPSHRSSTKKAAPPGAVNPGAPDRKSTRLNSSH